MLTKDQKRKIILQHPKISWKAKGLACAILEDEEIFADLSVRDKVSLLDNIGTQAYGAIHSGLNELMRNGLLLKKRKRIGEKWERSMHGVCWKLVFPEDASANENATPSRPKRVRNDLPQATM